MKLVDKTIEFVDFWAEFKFTLISMKLVDKTIEFVDFQIHLFYPLSFVFTLNFKDIKTTYHSDFHFSHFHI